MRGRLLMLLGSVGLIRGVAASLGDMNMALEFGLTPRGTDTNTGDNLQTFSGALGNAAADPILSTGNSQRPFSVDGNTFTDFGDALERSCANQHNSCANIANQGKSSGLTTGQCDSQQNSCLQATQGSGTAASSTASAQQILVSQDAEFLYICDK